MDANPFANRKSGDFPGVWPMPLKPIYKES